LFAFYKPLLTEKQQTFLQYYFHEDYTLAEIAEISSISRQAVYEHIKRAQTVLEDYESKLKLFEQHERRMEVISLIRKKAESLQADAKQDIVEALDLLARMEYES